MKVKPSIEILVEEPSAKEFLDALLPRIGFDHVALRVLVFNGKSDLLRKLPARLRGYRSFAIPVRVMVLIDRDQEDCLRLKAQLETMAASAGLLTVARARRTQRAEFTVCNRIAVEELEAWMLGDEAAMRAAFPRLRSYANKARFRDPDQVVGGTAEALGRLLAADGYYTTGLAKVDCARRVGACIVPDRNRSHSFRVFLEGLRLLCDMKGAP